MSGLEGCVVATIALSAAVVPPALAHTANAMLYLFFAIGTFAAPPLVAALGAKRTMMVCMAAYSLYLAAYIAPDPRVLYPAASLGGFAGALLWTAQGAYFTRNAVEYAACDPADSPTSLTAYRHCAAHWPASRRSPSHPPLASMPTTFAVWSEPSAMQTKRPATAGWG